MDKSAVILAVDSHGKFSEDKAFLMLNNKPLLSHVVSGVREVVDEVIVVAESKEQADAYAKIIPHQVQFVVDADTSKGSLAAALTGLEAAHGKYTLLLPFDSPFISKEVLSLLFEMSGGKSAVVPRWPGFQCEPLHAVYNTEQAIEAAHKALTEGETEAAAMLDCMHGVRYVSTMVIEQLDPDFRSFFTVKTPLDLKKAAVMKKPRKIR